MHSGTAEQNLFFILRIFLIELSITTVQIAWISILEAIVSDREVEVWSQIFYMSDCKIVHLYRTTTAAVLIPY